VSVAVQGQQIDPPPGVLPLAELLSDDQQVLTERGRLLAKQPLQVSPLIQAKLGEVGNRATLKPVCRHLV